MQPQWIIRSLHGILEASDEFIVVRFRLRLSGTLLTVEAEEESDDAELLSAACDLAYRYAAVLRNHVPGLMNLITLEEFAAMPAQVISVRGATTAERKRLSDGVRRARHAMLISGEPCLRQSYDYIEQAREDEINRLFHLYKFVETLEDAFAGETELISALDVKTSVKAIKRLANDRVHDARHAPRVSGKAERLSAEDQIVAMNYAYDILRAYEKYLRLQAGVGRKPRRVFRRMNER